jgi:pyrroline-5-carboxylate reductase
MVQNPSVSTSNDLFRDITIGFIGSGIMGEAIIASLLNQKLVTPNQIFAADPNQNRTDTLKADYGIPTTHSNLEVTKVADILILSIKPQMLDKVLHELHGHTDRAQVVLSIIAGAPIDRLADGLANARIVRAMPNTPARIGQGMTVWMATPEVPDQGRERVAAILAALGQELNVDGEQYLDMATALSGSGPAYVFLFMEAMIDAGVHLGFTRAVAERLVIQTMRGSVEYAAASGEHPSVLRNQVTSPGGTTAEALYHLEQSGLRATVARAVWASYQRSQTLGGGSGSVGPVDPANKR